MKRRRFLAASGSLLIARAALAQQQRRVYRIAVLLPTKLLAVERLAAIRERLASHGFVEGRNLGIEMRYPASWTQASREDAVREALKQQPDAILTTTTILTRAVQAATKSVPVVFAWVGDPVASGVVKDYARPGGNATGFSLRFFELTAKRFELLHELLPSVKRVAAVSRVWDDPPIETAWRSGLATARRLGIELVRLDLRDSVPDGSGAPAWLILDPFGIFGMNSAMREVVRYTVERRVPAIFADSESVEVGGLISYATNLHDDLRRGADLVARVLRGDKPGALPVDQAARFELAVNLRTARAIGVTVPKSVLLRADRVIE
jgi:putative tryptophan/tyrosine transport system substrate-binding protein